VPLTVSEASAVFDVLHWLGGEPVDDDRVAASLDLLANHAGKTLQLPVQAIEARQAIAHHLDRLAAPVFDVRRCRMCACTDDEACEGGCWWVADDLCSRCSSAAAGIDGQLTIEDVAP